MMTVKQFSDHYQLHPETIRRMIREDRLPGVIRIGHQYRIDEEKVRLPAPKISNSSQSSRRFRKD